MRVPNVSLIPHLLETTQRIDFVEILPESFIQFGGHRRRLLDALAERYPVIPHGVSLSIGGADPLDLEFLKGVRELCQRVDAPYWSDHIAMSMVDGIYLQELFPLPSSRQAIDHIVQRIGEVKRYCDAPLLLENIAFYCNMPGGEFDEASYLRRILEAADIGFLLDVSNVYVNSQNFGFDAKAFIKSLPLERVQQLHLGGCAWRDDLLFDSHAGPVWDEALQLFQFTLECLGRPVPICVEWETSIPSFESLLNEVQRVRHVAELAGTAEHHAEQDKSGEVFRNHLSVP